MNRTRHICAFMLLCLAGTSCVKAKLEVTYNNQEDKIDQYITKNMYVTRTTEEGSTTTDTLRVVYNGGANRLVTKEGSGEELREDGTIEFYYAGYVFSGSKSASNLFITNHEATATAAGWELTDSDWSSYRIRMHEAKLLEGLKKGLTGVKSGEECQILFSGKYGFGNKEFGIIPANSALLYEIWVEAISND